MLQFEHLLKKQHQTGGTQLFCCVLSQKISWVCLCHRNRSRETISIKFIKSNIIFIAKAFLQKPSLKTDLETSVHCHHYSDTYFPFVLIWFLHLRQLFQLPTLKYYSRLEWYLITCEGKSIWVQRQKVGLTQSPRPASSFKTYLAVHATPYSIAHLMIASTFPLRSRLFFYSSVRELKCIYGHITAIGA